MLTILVAFFSYLSSRISNKNSVLFEKPSINISLNYAEEDSLHINKITIETTSQNLDNVKIDVKPFLNIIFYLPNDKALIKEVLPVNDSEKSRSHFMPYDLILLNYKYGKLAEISLNDNSYSITENLFNYCESRRYNKNYDKILTDIFGDCILTSISFEMYVIIDYSDNLQNQYKEVYLCTTGYCGFTGNVTNMLLNTDSSVNNEILSDNLSLALTYCKLKANNIINYEFRASLEKVQPDDTVFKIFNEFCANSPHNFVNYAIHFNEELEKLIYLAYERKQLLFILTNEKPYWSFICV